MEGSSLMNNPGINHPVEDVTPEKYEKSVRKVMEWFRKNEYYELFDDYVEIVSNKSISDLESNITRSVITNTSDEKDSNTSNDNKEEKIEEQPVEHNSLLPGIIYNVTVINFESPESFQVIINRDNDMITEWNRLKHRLKKIKELKRLERLRQLKQCSLCLILIDDELYRGIIQRVYSSYIICYGVDTGKIYTIKRSSPIYQMTEEIRDTIEFQAINCKLHEVFLPQRDALNRFIHELFISTIKRAQIKIINIQDSRLIGNNGFPFKQYEVVLLDDSSSTNINQEIIFHLQGSNILNNLCYN